MENKNYAKVVPSVYLQLTFLLKTLSGPFLVVKMHLSYFGPVIASIGPYLEHLSLANGPDWFVWMPLLVFQPHSTQNWPAVLICVVKRQLLFFIGSFLVFCPQKFAQRA